jgi:hypothetical protein
MSKLYIGEYPDAALTEPPLVEHVIELGGTSVATPTFNRSTQAVRLHAETPCSVVFGENPVATVDNQRLAAEHTETRRVPQGRGFKIAAIENAGEGVGLSFGAIDEALSRSKLQ